MFKYLIIIFNNDLLFLKQRVETPLLKVITYSKQQKGVFTISEQKYCYNLNFKLQRLKGDRLKEQGEKLNQSLTVVRVIAN